MSDLAGYQVRLRVRIGTPLATDKSFLTVEVAGQEVTIRPQKDGEPLSAARWIVLGATGFETEGTAQDFGEQLRQMVEVAALCVRLGVDVGQNRPTTLVSDEWAHSTGLIQPHQHMLPNVHGLMVIPDDGLGRFPVLEATGAVRTYPAQLIASLCELGQQAPVRLATAAAGIRLLNLALMEMGSLGRLVLALSAVEALGQDETWSARQTALLNRLAGQVVDEAEGDEEGLEVADALRRSVHRIGLRQGVMRVLKRLGLNYLRKEWDRLYGLRSGVFHGTAHLTDTEVADLAQAAITLCGRVVLAAARQEGLRVPTTAGTYYPE